MERFLAQQRERDRQREGERRLPEVPEKTVDFSHQEEDRPLAGLPARWDGTFNRSYSPPSPHSVDFSESKQQPRPPGLEAASKDEVIENLSQLQSQLYMQLAECQRELDYAKSFNKEQETQHELRINELETGLREALQGRDRRESAIIPRLRDAEAQLSEANNRVKSWEDRCLHAEERVHRLEDQLRVIEERNRGLEDRNRQLEGEQRSLTQEIRRQREALSNTEIATAESRRVQQDLRSAKDRLAAAEAIVSDLQQENRQVTVLSDALARKEQEVSRAFEEKITAEQRVVDLSVRLRQY
jgi:chromosome segregation ATPase